MTVSKYKSGYTVKHCHGKKKPITKKVMTKAKAIKMHKAIQANKKK